MRADPPRTSRVRAPPYPFRAAAPTERTPPMTSASRDRDLRSQLETLTTEAFRPELADVDRLPTPEIARLMNAEDASVAGAVAEQVPAIAAAIDAVAERMARGGRLIYAGAGTAGRLGVLDASSARRPSTPTRRGSSA